MFRHAFVLIIMVAAVVVPRAVFADDPPPRPNVLMIAVDDLNDWVGVLGGHPQARTPNIDRLAERGVLYTRAYCAAPGCNASRTSLLFGQRPSTTGVYNNAHRWRDSPALRGAASLPRCFLDNGYKTLGAGKLFHAHTFFHKKNLRGYPDPRAWVDYFPSKTQQMPEEVVPAGWPISGTRRFYRGHFDWAPLNNPVADMADAKVAAWAKEQLAARHAKPLFLSVGIYRPHVPWYVPREYYDRFPLDTIELPPTLTNDLDDLPPAGRKMAKRRMHRWVYENLRWREAVQGYLASISFADDMVGELLDALDASPLSDNTIVVLWGDHGYHLGEKESWEKFALWEDTTHVPLIVFDPRTEESGVRCDMPVSLLDVYPTLVDLCELKPPRQSLEGDSLQAILGQSTGNTDRAVVSTQGMGNHAVRSKRFRYIRYADGGQELYDHQSDPHEWNNLADIPAAQDLISVLAGFLPKDDATPISETEDAGVRKPAATGG